MWRIDHRLVSHVLPAMPTPSYAYAHLHPTDSHQKLGTV